MEQKFSALLAVVGGLVDLYVGLLLLQGPAMQGGGMGMGNMSGQASGLWGGYLILAVGVVVLSTGLYMFAVRMLRNRSIFGVLMILYGLIMLVLGVGMIGQMFPMMLGSTLSGSVMIILGVAMLYSGSTMAKNRQSMTM